MLLALLSGGGALAEGLVRCEPALPVFCANVHVGCAGRSTRPTAAFDVDLAREPTEIRFLDQTVWEVVAARYDSGVVLRRIGRPDWIRVAPDMQFSQRLYGPSGALMAYGKCEPLD